MKRPAYYTDFYPRSGEHLRRCGSSELEKTIKTTEKCEKVSKDSEFGIIPASPPYRV